MTEKGIEGEQSVFFHARRQVRKAFSRRRFASAGMKAVALCGAGDGVYAGNAAAKSPDPAPRLRAAAQSRRPRVRAGTYASERE